MYACICRNIKESDYSNKKDLLDRLLQDDVICGSCQENFVKYKSKPNTFMGAWAYYSINNKLVEKV